jgi:hypothetical protein
MLVLASLENMTSRKTFSFQTKLKEEIFGTQRGLYIIISQTELDSKVVF